MKNILIVASASEDLLRACLAYFRMLDDPIQIDLLVKANHLSIHEGAFIRKIYHFKANALAPKLLSTELNQLKKSHYGSVFFLANRYDFNLKGYENVYHFCRRISRKGIWVFNRLGFRKPLRSRLNFYFPPYWNLGDFISRGAIQFCLFILSPFSYVYSQFSYQRKPIKV